MKVSIFGLGYLGTVSAGCLARDEHEVVGVDPLAKKVDVVNHGQSPIVETDVGVATLVWSVDDAESAIDLFFQVCDGLNVFSPDAPLHF
jgi:UDP-glucose 6-dehydrogenase